MRSDVMAGSGNDLGPCPYCGQHHADKVLLCPNTEKLLPLEGRILDGKFRFVRLLGEGGMGAVWKAENILVKKTVAIKLMHVQFSKDEGVLARFRNEATAAGRIGSDHICDILDLGRSDLGPYIVMEMLKGKDFATFLQQRQGRVDPGVSVLIVRESLKGLSAAHSCGIVHRDLKPENIFLHEPKPGQLMVKLMDFGISKFTEGSEAGKTGMGVLMGTPEYMSPEQTEGAAKVDHRTDIWAMGVILYWALSGRNPFLAPTLAATLVNVATREPPPLQALGGQVAPGLVEVIAHCLRKNPAERWQSCEELSNALAPYENRNNGIYSVEGAAASSATGPGRTMASAGSPTPPPGATIASPSVGPIGTSPTLGGMGGGPGGMLGMPGAPPGQSPGTAPTFVGGVPPQMGAGNSPTWSNEIRPSSNSNSAPTMGGGFSLSDDQLGRRPDSSLGGGSKAGLIVGLVLLLVVLGGGGWFAFSKMGGGGKGDKDGKEVASSDVKADGGAPVEVKADDGKADDGKAAGESTGPAPVADEAGAQATGGTGGETGTPSAEAGVPDDGKAPPTTGAAADGGAADGGAADGGAADGGEPADDGGKSDDDGGKPSNGGSKPKPKPKLVRTVGHLNAIKSPKDAHNPPAAERVCSGLNTKSFAGFNNWHVPSITEIKRFYPSGANEKERKLWISGSGGALYNPKGGTVTKSVRASGAQVVCVST